MRATNPSKTTCPDGAPVALILSVTNGKVTAPFCNNIMSTLTSTYADGSQPTFDMSMNKQCDKPGSGSSFGKSWAADIGLATEARFGATLNSPSFNFGGRRVKELLGGAASDGCWDQTSEVDQVLGITGGEWNVKTDNTWGDDLVGFPPSAVGYYRLHRHQQGLTGTALGCTVSSRATPMGITCAGSSAYAQYTTNDLSFGLTDEQYVFAFRDGAGQTLYWIP